MPTSYSDTAVLGEQSPKTPPHFSFYLKAGAIFLASTGMYAISRATNFLSSGFRWNGSVAQEGVLANSDGTAAITMQNGDEAVAVPVMGQGGGDSDVFVQSAQVEGLVGGVYGSSIRVTYGIRT